MLDIDALRDELTAARGVLEPQIRGIEALLRAAPDAVFADELQAQLTLHNTRWDLLTAVLRSCDQVSDKLVALQEDGYPQLKIAPIGTPDFDALASEMSDIASAVELFGHEASGVSVSLNAPQEK